MKPVRTPRTNTNLVLPGGTEDNDLPAERTRFYNAELGQTEADAVPGFETTWQPTEAEREHLADGAPLVLRIWGDGHPPVSIQVPAVEGQDDPLLIERNSVMRALALMFAGLSNPVPDRGPLMSIRAGNRELQLTAEAFEGMWSRCLSAVRGEPLPEGDDLVPSEDWRAIYIGGTRAGEREWIKLAAGATPSAFMVPAPDGEGLIPALGIEAEVGCYVMARVDQDARRVVYSWRPPAPIAPPDVDATT